MIDPTAIVFIVGYIVGMFASLVLVAVAVSMCSKGKEPEFVEIKDKCGEGHYICPICGMDVSFYKERNLYCSECGQKIDWRKVDGKDSVRCI